MTTKNTETVAVTSNPATIQLCAFLRELCDYHKRIEAFHDSTDGAILRDVVGGDYQDFEVALFDALSRLSRCIGPYLTDEYCTTETENK